MVEWQLPVGSPPEVVAMGRNAHGFEPFDSYCLPDLWSLHLYGYEARIKMGSHEFDVKPGWIALTPPGVSLETHYQGISVHLYVHFRADGALEPVLAVQDLGDLYNETYRRLYSVHSKLERQPDRVNACVWDVLWTLIDLNREDKSDGVGHPAVMAAVERISKRLSGSISVEALADEVGVSTSYLSKLFNATYGETVIAYIRRNRLERAKHLLERSNLPIKAIAISVGIPDLQHFNKAMRQQYGSSPRTVRNDSF